MRISIEKSNKVGIGLFWIAIIWAALWGVIGGFFASSAMNSITPADLDQSIWNVTGPLMMTYGLSPALGAFLAGIGAMIYAGANRSTVWGFGIGIFLCLAIAMVGMQSGWYYPPLFGIGGALIILFFTGILLFWAKERMKLQSAQAAAADYKLAGYVFLMMATWFTCGIGSQPFLDALEGMGPTNPIHIMFLLVLGWLFLFLSHYTSRQQQG
jgi:hypothetical protein